jgi:hypothetical protein
MKATLGLKSLIFDENMSQGYPNGFALFSLFSMILSSLEAERRFSSEYYPDSE